jgi:hypothetical protein
VVTAAGVEALRQGALVADSERKEPSATELIAIDAMRSGAHD